MNMPRLLDVLKKTVAAIDLSAALNTFLPVYCRLCGDRVLDAENGVFCPRCWESSPRVERPFCTRCGKPHQRMVALGALSNFPCADCRECPDRHLNRVWGAAHYEGAVSLAVKMLKFHDRPALAAPLGELMREFALREMDVNAYDVLAPVPLHRVRHRHRGYNQSELLARELSSVFIGAPLDLALQRIRPTHAQSSLAREQRAQNVRGAFAVRGDSLKGRRVLLVDDVITTGGTISECARALKRAGAVSVEAFAAALAVTPVTLDFL